ncbi:MAG: LacI family DNA-binding transcriptional regulator [Clostridia bacterium]|nr:LacI family DNA-binding transcriptional regulator [Clostridia bacterium]
MDKKKKITIYDLARETGFSVGTVNRALSGKNRISPTTRDLIIHTANRLGYKANAAAQGLRRTPLRFGAILFCPVAEYVEAIANGIRAAAADLEKYNVSVELCIIPYTDNASCCAQSLTLLHHFSKEHFDGMVLFLSANRAELTELSAFVDQMTEAGIPTATVANDLPDSRRLFYVGINAYMAGNMAAELLSLCCPGQQIAILTSSDESEVNRQYLHGFNDYARRNVFDSIKIYNHFDRPDLVMQKTEQLLNDNPELGGIYMTTASSSIACRKIREIGKKNLKIVTTDLLKDTPDLFHNGITDAVIFQNPFRQGKDVIKALYTYLTQGVLEKTHLLTPILLFSSNVKDYL